MEVGSGGWKVEVGMANKKIDGCEIEQSTPAHFHVPLPPPTANSPISEE